MKNGVLYFIWVIDMSYNQDGHIEKFCEGVKWKNISNLNLYLFIGLVRCNTPGVICNTPCYENPN
jgi:hypothetical protein